MKYLKIARIAQGLSQWDLADKTKIPNYRISLIETGRVDPTPGELRRLAEVLGVPAKMLNKEISRDQLRW